MSDDKSGVRSGATRRAPSPRLVLAGVAGLLLALIAVLNLDDVRVDWLVDSFRAPLIVVIVVGALLGFVIGYLTRAHRGR